MGTGKGSKGDRKPDRMLGFCLQVGPSIRARPRPAKDGQPYLEMSPANYPVSGFPLWFVSIVVLPSFSPQNGELSLKPIRCIGIIDVRTFRRCGKLYEINFATCTRELAGRAGCQSVAKD